MYANQKDRKMHHKVPIPKRKSNAFLPVDALAKNGCLKIRATEGLSFGSRDRHWDMRSDNTGSATFSRLGSNVGRVIVIFCAERPSKNPLPVLISYMNIPNDQTS